MWFAFIGAKGRPFTEEAGASLSAGRADWMRKNRTPGDLERFWLGHANKTVTDDYSRLKEDVTFRKEVAEKVGIAFELPTQSSVVAPNAPKKSANLQ